MDEILRFWAEVACENLQSSGANLTKRQRINEFDLYFRQKLFDVADRGLREFREVVANTPLVRRLETSAPVNSLSF
jgi:hypothetical protein